MSPGPGPGVRSELGRKAIHLATAALPVAWGLGFVDRRAVLFLLAASTGLAVMVEGLRRWSPLVGRRFEALFGALLRRHEHRSDHAAGGTAITGATWLALSMLACALALPPAAAITALWAAAAGDAFAALVGRVWSRGATTPARKTAAGSLACAAVTALGAWWLGQAPSLVALVVGCAAAAAERPILALDDNVRISVAAGLTAWVLGVA